MAIAHMDDAAEDLAGVGVYMRLVLSHGMGRVVLDRPAAMRLHLAAGGRKRPARPAYLAHFTAYGVHLGGHQNL